MELYNPCRECIETNLEITMQSLQGYVTSAFGVLAMELGRFYQDSLASDTFNEQGQLLVLDLINRNTALATSITALATSITRAESDEFYSYYVFRGL
jgi:hypothetical protein